MNSFPSDTLKQSTSSRCCSPADYPLTPSSDLFLFTDPEATGIPQRYDLMRSP